VSKVRLEPREKTDPRERTDPPVRLALRVRLDLWDLLEKMVCRVLQDPMVRLVPKVPPVIQGQPDSKVPPAKRAQQAPLDKMESLAPKVLLVGQGQRVLQDRRDLKVVKARQEPLASMVQLVQREKVVCKVPLAPKALMAKQVPWVFLDPLEGMVQQGQMALLVPQDPRDPRDPQVPQDRTVPPDLKDRTATLELQGPKGRMDPLAQLAVKESQGALVQ
jgi:hypothetical protein